MRNKISRTRALLKKVAQQEEGSSSRTWGLVVAPVAYHYYLQSRALLVNMSSD